MKPKLQLESLEQLGWRFGLQTIQTLLSELDHPELSLRVIHVAGSNGKGSTCAFLSSFLTRQGYRTGLYTSPHLCDVRERFRINGNWISPKEFQFHREKVLGVCQKVKSKLGHFPTHFEALTAVAFSWFKEQKADWVVLEVGLGGRLDATNVIPAPAVSLITPVSLEHQAILGKTLEKIAAEKAGILKEGCLAATIQYDRKAARVIDRIADQKGAKLWLEGRDFTFRKEPKGFYWEGPGLSRHFNLSLLPDFQVINAPLAVAGIQCSRAFGVGSDGRSIEASLSSMRWPGRAEIINRKPFVMLDGAHNPSAALLLFTYLRSRFPKERWVVLNGYLKDKNYKEIIKTLGPLTDFSIVTRPESERAANGVDVFNAWKNEGVACGLMRNWEEAFPEALAEAARRDRPLLVTGSLYLVGDCRRAFKGMKDLKRI